MGRSRTSSRHLVHNSDDIGLQTSNPCTRTCAVLVCQSLTPSPAGLYGVQRLHVWFAKTLAEFEIIDLAAHPPLFCYNSYSHASIYRPVPRNAGSPLARASEPLTRESGAASTTRRLETSASVAKTRPARQAPLGRRPPILVRMATIPHCGQARNGGALALGRIPFVLEADLKGQEARRETTDVEGGSGIDLPDGC